jgi:endonuclease/exonuclease/phosphatase (EEP) superfamily protein YafD
MDGKWISTNGLVRKISIVVAVTMLLASSAFAKRWGLAKKYSIPPMSQSYASLGSSSAVELDPDSIKVLVWNLYKGEKKSFVPDFKKYADGHDILLIQEGYWNPKMTGAFSYLSQYRFDMGVSFLYNKDNYTKTGTVIGSRIEPIDFEFVRTRNMEPFIRTPKTTAYAYYPIAGSSKSLLVVNIHGMNLTKHQSFVNQVNQAVDIIVQHDGPVIYAGDFNTRTKKRLKYMRDAMRMIGMTEIGYRNDKRMKVKILGHILDHTFIKDLLVRDSEVLKDVKGSDHKAMKMDFVYVGE